MNPERNDITNRPRELTGLPHYGHLPEREFAIDLPSAMGKFLANDLFDLDGVQPVEKSVLDIDGGVIEVNPSEKALEFYEGRGDIFQMVNVVVCCYAFEEKDGQLFGLPYNVSLKSAEKQGRPSSVAPDWLRNMDLNSILDGRPRYMGFNPFKNAFGLYGIGPLPINKNINSDVVGFVYNTYFLASKADVGDVCEPGMCSSLIGDNRSILNDYRQYRNKRYFKWFADTKPRKVWGCDSPIELFLLQAMKSVGLQPTIQTHVFKDGSTFPTLQEMWQSGKRTKSLSRSVTEVDFFFEREGVAVFCDSNKHHSSPEAVRKDQAIDEALREIGVESLRIRGQEIMESPLKCARRVFDVLDRSV